MYPNNTRTTANPYEQETPPPSAEQVYQLADSTHRFAKQYEKNTQLGEKENSLGGVTRTQRNAQIDELTKKSPSPEEPDSVQQFTELVIQQAFADLAQLKKKHAEAINAIQQAAFHSQSLDNQEETVRFALYALEALKMQMYGVAIPYLETANLTIVRYAQHFEAAGDEFLKKTVTEFYTEIGITTSSLDSQQSTITGVFKTNLDELTHSVNYEELIEKITKVHEEILVVQNGGTIENSRTQEDPTPAAPIEEKPVDEETKPIAQVEPKQPESAGHASNQPPSIRQRLQKIAAGLSGRSK